MDFERKWRTAVVNTFPPTSNIAAVVKFVREQNIPGKIEITLPGNGGVTSITFTQKDKTHNIEIEGYDQNIV
jgi:hypothetical protein